MKKLDAPQYLQLNKGGSPARLACLKQAARNHNERRPPSTQKTWQECRSYGFKSWHAAYAALSAGANDKTPVWYCHTGPQFRDELAHVIKDSSVDHRGWYSDTFQDERVIGIVGFLPHGKYIAGYYWTSNGERVYYPEVYTDLDQAIRDADHYAERYAEEAREHDEKYQEALKLEDTLEESIKRLRECLILRHQACMKYVRDEVETLIQKIRSIREELKQDYAGVL